MAVRQRYLFADIDEDFPALDALQFENAALKPGIVLHLFSHLIFIFRFDDQKSALRQSVSSTKGPPIKMKPSSTS